MESGTSRALAEGAEDDVHGHSCGKEEWSGKHLLNLPVSRVTDEWSTE